MLKSEELYCIINSSRDNKPTSHIYFEKKFDSKELDWRFIYTLPRKVTTNTYLSSFLCKVLNNILYMNEKRFVFGLSTTSFLWLYNKTIYLEKITVELEKWFNSFSNNTTSCHLRFPWTRLPILLNPKSHSSHFETVRIQV